MKHMFCAASSFNQPLEKWDVSNVADMGCMFSGAFSFNQPLEQWKVTDMRSLFL
jgi:surface protein